MQNKINFKQLTQIKETFGDFEIGQVWGGDNDVYLRFGYWNQVDAGLLQQILGNSAKVVVDDDYDDDCGWRYSYRLK